MNQAVSQEMQDDPPDEHPAFLEAIQATLQFVESLKNKVFVVKLGGSTLHYQRAVLQDSSSLPRMYCPHQPGSSGDNFQWRRYDRASAGSAMRCSMDILNRLHLPL